MKNVITVIWHEFQIFKSKFVGVTASSMVSPILYLIAFGWGIGANLEDGSTNYINFIVYGIIGMTTMTGSYSAVANGLNIARTYDKTFEEYMMSPIKSWEYTLGKILAGALRGLYSGTIITVLAILFLNLKINLGFIIIVILNCITFAALGFIVGMIIESHTDMNKFNSFIITPMSFLSGTFFPIDRMPVILKDLIRVLPLSLTNTGLRNLWDVQGTIFTIGILILYFMCFYAAGVRFCKSAE